MRKTNCWSCGAKIEADDAEFTVTVGRRQFCDESCYWHQNDQSPDYPIDYDAQDRNAAMSERIDTMRRER